MTLGLVCDSCDALSPMTVAACHSCKASLALVARQETSQPAIRPFAMSVTPPSEAVSTPFSTPLPNHAVAEAPVHPNLPAPVRSSRPQLLTPARSVQAPSVAPARSVQAPSVAPARSVQAPSVAPARPGQAPPVAPVPGRAAPTPPPAPAWSAPASSPAPVGDVQPLTARATRPTGAPSPIPAPPPSAIRTCPTCGDQMPISHHFCGNCGTRFDQGAAPSPTTGPSSPSAKHPTLFFGTMQEPRAKLILIKGEGFDGVSYMLAGAEHVAGRTEGEVLFPDDRLLSPRHANFFYRDRALMVRDESSANGVFLRIRGPVVLEPDQPFLVGEQLLVVRPAVMSGLSAPDADGTYFYGSPRRPARMHLTQLLVGGSVGLVLRATIDTVSIGREGNQVDFPEDPFISGHHAQVSALDDGRFRLDDLNSKNGTFVRVRGETRLEHGDYVFLGQQLLRVEIT